MGTETTLPAPRDRLLLFAAGILTGLALAVGGVAYATAKGEWR